MTQDQIENFGVALFLSGVLSDRAREFCLDSCSQTGWIIAPIFASIMQPKGTPDFVSRIKSPEILTTLYPVDYFCTIFLPLTYFPLESTRRPFLTEGPIRLRHL